MSEDIPAVVPARDEYSPTRRRQKQAAHDQAQVRRIHARKLWREERAEFPGSAGEHVHISGPSAARTVAPCRDALGGAPAPAPSPSHIRGIQCRRL